MPGQGSQVVGPLRPAEHTMRRRPANNIPIPPASGAFVGEVYGPVNALEQNAIAALTTWGGYRQTLPPGGYTVSLDVFVDARTVPADPNARFVFAVTATNPDTCQPTGHIYFRAGNQENRPDAFCFSVVDSDPTGPPCDGNDVINYERDPEAFGWFTFVVEFFANTATLEMTARTSILLDGQAAGLSQTFVIPGGYGGNHFAWFPYISGYDAVYIDNAIRTTGGVTPS